MKIFATISLLIIPLSFASAQNPPSAGGPIFFNPLGTTNDFFVLITKILDVLIKIGIPILVLFIVYAGFKFVTAQGNEAEVTKAKEALFWAVVGGAVLIGARVIAGVVCATVGSLAC